jgi:RND family efflux transporter MFP subunit
LPRVQGKCPSCDADNVFPRLKPDIYSARDTEPDGHPHLVRWRAEFEFPLWLTPLNYFWAICQNCFFTGQIDDTEFRTWKKTERKFRSLFREGALVAISDLASKRLGVARKMGTSIPADDIFGTLLAQFYLGIYSECLKERPVPGSLARFYLRISWIYRDEEKLYSEFAQSSTIRKHLEATTPDWLKSLPTDDSLPVVPLLANDELSALRTALAYFEWNFAQLHSNALEDTLRLTTLIAEIGYRIYELSGDGEDFKKGQSYFSGVMSKSMGIINDKSIVGGAVNRAKEVLEKAGERGRELRTLNKKWLNTPVEERKAAPTKAVEPVEKEEATAPAEATVPAPDAKPKKPSVFDQPQGNTKELEDRIAQLDEDNKKWMKLAGFSEITGLPNRVMLSRVFLPGALRQAVAKKQSIGCVFLAPQGLDGINGKYGRTRGDDVLRKVAESVKEILRKGERLTHIDSVNFGLLISGMTTHQLAKRAETMAQLKLDVLDQMAIEAEANLEFQSYNFKHSQDLLAEGSISEQAHQQSKYAYKSALSRAQTIATRRGFGNIRAPFRGRIAKRFIDIGQMVNQGGPAFRVAQVDSIRLTAWVSESEIVDLQKGRKVTLTLDAFPGEMMEGMIGKMGVAADDKRRVFPVEVHMANISERILPGMLGKVQILRHAYRGVVVASREAILERETGPVAFVVVDNRAFLRPLELGAAQNDRVVVRSGLGFGDRLIIRGNRDLIDGDPIQTDAAP